MNISLNSIICKRGTRNEERGAGGTSTACHSLVPMDRQENLVSQLRELVGCATLTAADLGNLSWHTKQRVLLGLLAELPEGRETVMVCAQLQAERNRTRQLNKAAKALPEASRRAENRLRQAFFEEVGRALTSMDAAPALRMPKKMRGDPDVCLRVISFLAARVRRRQRRSSASGLSSTSSLSTPAQGAAALVAASSPAPLSAPPPAPPPAPPTAASSAPSAPSTLSTSALHSNNTGSFEEELPLAHSGDRNRPAGLSSATETPRPSRRRRSLPPGSTLFTQSTAVTASASAAAAEAAAAADEPATETEEGRLEFSSAVVTNGRVAVKGLRADGVGEIGGKDGSEWTTTRGIFASGAAPRGGGGVNPRVGKKGLGSRLSPTSPPHPPPLPPSSSASRSGAARACAEDSQRSRMDDAGGGGGSGGGDSISFKCNDRNGGNWQGARPSEVSRGRCCSTTTTTRAKEKGSATAEAPLQSPSPLALGEGPCRGSVGSAGQARLDPAVSRDHQAAADADSSIGVCSGSGGSSTRRINGRSRAGDASLDGGWDGVGDAVGLEISIVGDRSLGRRSRTPGRERRTQQRWVAPRHRAHAGRRGGPATAVGAAATAERRSTAAASDAILRGQVAQLRRQVRLQWCAVDASAAVNQEVKAVLGHLEETLAEVSSLGQPPTTTPLGSGFRASTATPRAAAAATATATSAAACGKAPTGRVGGAEVLGAAGGVGGAAALPAWHQVLDRVRALAEQLQWAERATQRAADGRMHVTQDSGKSKRQT
eukprot:jgi/Undpi1/3669/HiC_scaffold_16.g07039.m1